MIKNTEPTTRPAGPIHPTVAAKMFRTRLRNRIPLKMPKRWMHRELKAGGVFESGSGLGSSSGAAVLRGG
jgi:hypothetical protein